MENTLFVQENNGKVYSKELFFIHSAFANIRVNADPFIFTQMRVVCTVKRGPICIGGLITSISHALGQEDELATMGPLPTPSLDIFLKGPCALSKHGVTGSAPSWLITDRSRALLFHAPHAQMCKIGPTCFTICPHPH